MSQQDERLGLPSASGGERWYNCPGSIAMEAQAPPEAPSDEALQGDEIHEALESEDFTELDAEGRTIAEQLKAQEEKAVAKWKQDAKETGKVSVHREERLWLKKSRTQPQPVASAKVDVLYIGDKSALVIDTKTGYLNVTPAYRNIQARIQALAVWHEFPRVQHVQAGISAYRFRGSWDPVDYYVPELVQSEQELTFNLWRTKQPHAPRVPGPWCKYCRAKAFCPQAASFGMLPLVHTGPALMKKPDVIAKVQTLDPPQVAFILEHAPMIKNFLEAVKDRAMGFSDEELASVGWHKVPTGNMRSVPDIQKLWAEIHRSGLLTEEEFRACLKATLGKIEEALVAKITKNTAVSEKVALASAKQIISPAVELKPKQPTLKPINKALADE